MHIAHFTNTYYPRISGVVRSVSAFRKALSEMGHNVFIFAQDAGEYQDTEPFIFRYPTINLPLPDQFPATIPISPFVDRLLPCLKLDVIHTHHPFLLGQTAAQKAEELNLPLVFTFHTRYRDYTHYFPIPQEIVQEFVKNAVDTYVGEFMQKCQHIVVPTESMREMLHEEYGLEARTTVIPTGIELEPFGEADGASLRAKRGWGDDCVLISVGRLGKEKNWETLLEACAQVIPKHPELRVVLVGDGPQREELQDYVAQLGIALKVEFVGKVPFDQIPAYLKAADLFGFASTTETQGLVTMEALASGLPVVAVNATGTRDVVEHGKEGLLTEDDSGALACAIESVLEEETLYNRFRQEALKKARTFDIKRQAARLLEVYQQAIEDKKADRFVEVKKQKGFRQLIDEKLPKKISLGRSRGA
jgi:glycosyltransferase involved in cell wall biosynthesis